MSHRFLLIAGVMFLGAAALTTALRGEGVVELPSFVLTETIVNKPWRYGKIAGFEFLSQCSDKTTQGIADALVRGRAITLPGALRPKLDVPTSVILFDQEPEQVTAVGALRRADGHWTNVLKRTAPDREIFCVNLSGGKFRYSSTFRFDTQTLLTLRVPPAPDWVQEALYGTEGVYRDGVQSEPYGSDVPPACSVPPGKWISPAETLTIAQLLPMAEERVALRKKEHNAQAGTASSLTALLLPLDQLFAPAPEASEEKSRRSAELALFARWGMFADEGDHAEGFWRFVVQSCSQPNTEGLFQKCFGLTYHDAWTELSWYLPLALSDSAVRAVVSFELPALKLRPATEVEIARLRGDWERTEAGLLTAHFPEIAARYRTQARRRLHAAYQHGARDPELLATLGLYEFDAGNSAEARTWLEAAAKAGVVRPLAYLELARLRFNATNDPSEGVSHRLSAEQIADVLGPLFTARNQRPAMIAVYDLAAEIWARSARKPARENLAILLEGARLFPRDLGFALKAAQLHARHGYVDEARVLCERALLFATSAATRQPLELLLSNLPK